MIKQIQSTLFWGRIRCKPVTLNVLDKEDVIIVRSCIPGNDARDICFSLLKVICSYTCTNIQKDKIHNSFSSLIQKKLMVQYTYVLLV